MKKVMVSSIVLLLFMATISNAALSVTWNGETWGRVNSPTDLQVVDGNLEVIQSAASPGLAQLGGLGGIVNTSYFELTADLDKGPQSGAMIADYATQGAQIIVDFAGQQIITFEADGSSQASTSLPALPTSGVHKIDFQLGGDNLITVELDDVFLWKAPIGLEMDTIQSAYAASVTTGKGVFVPEPATMCLMALGGLLLCRKK